MEIWSPSQSPNVQEMTVAHIYCKNSLPRVCLFKFSSHSIILGNFLSFFFLNFWLGETTYHLWLGMNASTNWTNLTSNTNNNNNIDDRQTETQSLRSKYDDSNIRRGRRKRNRCIRYTFCHWKWQHNAISQLIIMKWAIIPTKYYGGSESKSPNYNNSKTFIFSYIYFNYHYHLYVNKWKMNLILKR